MKMPMIYAEVAQVDSILDRSDLIPLGLVQAAHREWTTVARAHLWNLPVPTTYLDVIRHYSLDLRWTVSPCPWNVRIHRRQWIGKYYNRLGMASLAVCAEVWRFHVTQDMKDNTWRHSHSCRGKGSALKQVKYSFLYRILLTARGVELTWAMVSFCQR